MTQERRFRAHLQISFYTEFNTLSNGIVFVYIYFAKYQQTEQKLNFYFWCFASCYTSKLKAKQTP